MAPETNNNCAGDGQQQSAELDWSRKSLELHCYSLLQDIDIAD
jgi:hypothetical protein